MIDGRTLIFKKDSVSYIQQKASQAASNRRVSQLLSGQLSYLLSQIANTAPGEDYLRQLKKAFELVLSGADVNTRDTCAGSHQTLLHHYVNAINHEPYSINQPKFIDICNTKIEVALTMLNGDISFKNARGHTPFDALINHTHFGPHAFKLACILLENGADHSAVDSQGRTFADIFCFYNKMMDYIPNYLPLNLIDPDDQASSIISYAQGLHAYAEGLITFQTLLGIMEDSSASIYQTIGEKTIFHILIDKYYHLSGLPNVFATMMKDCRDELFDKMDHLIHHEKSAYDVRKSSHYFKAPLTYVLDLYTKNQTITLDSNLDCFKQVTCPDDLIELLITAGADPNTRSSQGDYLLHYLCHTQLVESYLVEMVLEQRAHPNACNVHHFTPLDVLSNSHRSIKIELPQGAPQVKATTLLENAVDKATMLVSYGATITNSFLLLNGSSTTLGNEVLEEVRVRQLQQKALQSKLIVLLNTLWPARLGTDKHFMQLPLEIITIILNQVISFVKMNKTDEEVLGLLQFFDKQFKATEHLKSYRSLQAGFNVKQYRDENNKVQFTLYPNPFTFDKYSRAEFDRCRPKTFSLFRSKDKATTTESKKEDKKKYQNIKDNALYCLQSYCSIWQKDYREVLKALRSRPNSLFANKEIIEAAHHLDKKTKTDTHSHSKKRFTFR